MSYEKCVPSEEHRLITVNGLNLPAFPTDEELKSHAYGGLAAANALADWVDMTLIANQVTSSDDEKWRVPDTLWVPLVKGGAVQLASHLTRINGTDEEPHAFFQDEMRTVQNTITTTHRSICTPPKKVAPTLEHLFLHEDVVTTGNYQFGTPVDIITRKIGDITIEDTWEGPYFYNEKTGAHPNQPTAERMATTAAQKILASLGYQAKAFTKWSQTFGDYLADLAT